MTDAQKALVNADALQKLTDAEAALAEAQHTADQAAADEVNKALSGLPEADAVTLADKEAIEAARDAYNALTDDQKALVDSSAVTKLEAAVGALAAAEEAQQAADQQAADQSAADKVAKTLSGLPAASAVTVADNSKIKAARAAYNALTAAQKKLVSASALKKLTDAEKALTVAQKAAAEYAANNGYIDPKLPKVKIKGPKKAKKSFTAKWKKLKKKQLKVVKGIEIEYSLTSDFKDPKFKTTSKKKASLKIKGLKSKKTYYVRAHTYVYKGGKKYVSNWSAPKRVKVK